MSPDREALHVGCAVVGDYLPHLAAALASLLANGGEPDVVIHLLHDDTVGESDRRRLASMLRESGGCLESYDIPDERLEGVPTAGFTGKGSWYRIFLPGLIPDVDRLLYLDADVLVLDSLIPLRDVDLSAGYVAAVTNVFELESAGRAMELGLAGPGDYFNAGVLVMNLDAMRRDRSTDELLRFARAHADELVFRDQDALNVVLGKGRTHLHPRWNCMNSIVSFRHSIDLFGEEQVAEARDHPAIRHFEGPSIAKPWHYLADLATRELYARYRAATPWPRIELEDRRPVTRAIRWLPPSQRARAYRRLVRWRSTRSPDSNARIR